MEQATLYKFTDIRKDVRLSCCIPVEKWMDGCTFEIWAPPELSELTELHWLLGNLITYHQPIIKHLIPFFAIAHLFSLYPYS